MWDKHYQKKEEELKKLAEQERIEQDKQEQAKKEQKKSMGLTFITLLILMPILIYAALTQPMDISLSLILSTSFLLLISHGLSRFFLKNKKQFFLIILGWFVAIAAIAILYSAYIEFKNRIILEQANKGDGTLKVILIVLILLIIAFLINDIFFAKVKDDSGKKADLVVNKGMNNLFVTMAKVDKIHMRIAISKNSDYSIISLKDAEVLGVNTANLNFSMPINVDGSELMAANSVILNVKIDKYQEKMVEFYIIAEDLEHALLGKNFLNQFFNYKVIDDNKIALWY